MSVTNGQPVDAPTTNAAYLDKNQDTSTQFNIQLASPVSSDGSTVTRTQRCLNALSSFMGVATSAVYNILPSWATNNRGSSTNNIFQRVEAIDTAFDGTTGHMHSGTAGDGPILPTFTSTTSGLAPASGGGSLKYLRADGSWDIVSGGGSGTGAKNYITNPNFEGNTTSGWSLGNTSLTNKLPTGSPTFGSGASGNLSISIISSGQLAGIYSMSESSSSATTAGDFLATDALTIDIEDQAKIMQFKFYYSVNSGVTNTNFSGTSSNSFGVAIYDVTNSAWIIPSGVFNLVQGYGVGIASGTWQTPANMTQFRFVLYNANATSGAVTLYLDDFFVGPQIALNAPAMDDWRSYTPTITGFGTPSNINFISRRVGGNLEVQGRFTSGTSTATAASITLGYGGGNSNVTVDSTLVPNYLLVGSASRTASSSTFFNIGTIVTGGNNFLQFGLQSSTTGIIGAVQNGSAISGNGETFVFNATVPISGWSSNSVSSSDTDTRVISARATGDNVSHSYSSSTPLQFNIVTWDTHAAITTGTSWKYVAPVTGYYRVAFTLSNASGAGVATLYKNGSSYMSMANFSTSNASGGTSVQLNTGDYLDIRPTGSVTTTLDTSECSIAIERISGPAIVQASETVAASYYVSPGSYAPGSGAFINFDTKNYDTHNETTTGTGWKYTAPIQGIYGVSFTGTQGASTGSQIYLYKNGSSYANVGYLSPSTPNTVSTFTSLQLNPGDYIQIYSSSSATFSGGSSPQFTYVEIIRYK